MSRRITQTHRQLLAPQFLAPFHSSRKKKTKWRLYTLCSLFLPKHHGGAISLSMASSLENIPLISPQELGFGSQQSKGHPPSAFTLLQCFVCCLLLCIRAWQHSPAHTHGQQSCKSSLCMSHLSHCLDTKPQP